MTPNSNATEWTIRLKKGITFHNGKPLTADDVIFTFQQCLNPKAPAPSALLLGPVVLGGIKKVDNLTVTIPCKTPYSALPQMIQNYNLPIMPVGFDKANPVGTGPFKFKSFTPGEVSLFERNENYFETGLPYVDSVQITDYADETSMTNALLGNQEDAIGGISVDSVASMLNGGQTLVYSNAGGIIPFTMRVDAAPFNDVRVRQAMRLLVDRKQMRELVFGGHGLLGNDVTSPFDVAYDGGLPQREVDLPQAKYLLKKAGMEDLTVDLVTTQIGQGAVLGSQVLAQQATKARRDHQPEDADDFRVLRTQLPEMGVRPGPLLLLALHAAGHRRLPADIAVQRDAFQRSALHLALQPGAGDDHAGRPHADRAGDDEDRLRAGRLHHPLLQSRHRRPHAEAAGSEACEDRCSAAEFRDEAVLVRVLGPALPADLRHRR